MLPVSTSMPPYSSAAFWVTTQLVNVSRTSTRVSAFAMGSFPRMDEGVGSRLALHSLPAVTASYTRPAKTTGKNGTSGSVIVCDPKAGRKMPCAALPKYDRPVLYSLGAKPNSTSSPLTSSEL
jgi:hypothetical protein